MPAPLFRQFMPNLSQPARGHRYIDNHYHLEMIAENSGQLVEYQDQLLRLQYEAAITNIRAMGEIAQRQDKTTNLLSALVGDMHRLSNTMDTLNATARETLDALYTQTDVLQQGFEDIATRLMEQQKVLQEIADILRRPYNVQALELLNEADRALKTGMKASGRDQEEEFKDAARLLGDVLGNPIGSRNYVAWFQLGWLNWQFKRNLAEAEEAFYQAARLSGPETDFFHAYSLWHLANMTGSESEALEMLDKCIDLKPQTIITMFSEEDFVS